jgi:hypothetical protein
LSVLIANQRVELQRSVLNRNALQSPAAQQPQLNHEVTERLGAGIQATGQVAIQEYIHGKFTYTRVAFLVFGDQGQARINLESKKPTVCLFVCSHPLI